MSASVAALAAVSGAGPADAHLSVLPPSLLLEQIAGVFVPVLTGARIVVCPRPDPLPSLAARGGITTTVLVPELLSGWVAWLRATGRRAPAGLRFVAVGGAPVPPRLADAAWSLGLPVHEGYGLSECCSVVAVNRPGERAAGTVGRPVPGVAVTIEDGEIVVAGPTVMEGYRHGAPAGGRWRTGDLGAIDDAGRLIVHGRRDDLVVIDNGRKVHPEWIEQLLLADDRFARCAVLPGGNAPRAVVVPSANGRVWIEGGALRADLLFVARSLRADLLFVARSLCSTAPDYARPGEAEVAGFARTISDAS